MFLILHMFFLFKSWPPEFFLGWSLILFCFISSYWNNKEKLRWNMILLHKLKISFWKRKLHVSMRFSWFSKKNQRAIVILKLFSWNYTTHIWPPTRALSVGANKLVDLLTKYCFHKLMFKTYLSFWVIACFLDLEMSRWHETGQKHIIKTNYIKQYTYILSQVFE